MEPVAVAEAPPTSVALPEQKPKKVRSEAQKENTVKALAALKAKREALAAKEREEIALLGDAALSKHDKKKLSQLPKIPAVAEFITKGDLERFKADIFSMMPKEVVREVQVPVEKVVVREKYVPVEKTVVRERVVQQEVPVERKISGNELLDRIFFSR